MVIIVPRVVTVDTVKWMKTAARSPDISRLTFNLLKSLFVIFKGDEQFVYLSSVQ